MNNNDLLDSETLVLEEHNPTLKTVLRLLVTPVVIAGICVAASRINYLLFHTLAELFSIVIALTALVVASTSRHFTRNHFTVYVAVAIGWCAALDLVHTLAYKGMHLFGPDDANLPTQLWIAARFIQALALLLSPLFLRRSVRVGYLHAGFGLTALAVTLWIFSGTFPAAFIEGQGLTAFKIDAEYVIIGMLAASAVLLWRQRGLMSPSLFLNMQMALVAMILSELAFTRYVSVYGEANLIGHIFKIFAYWFVYLALVQSTLREPFSMLSRTASTYEAVPDPTFVILNEGGLIQQANRAAARYVGMPPEDLIGRPMHPLFHAPAVRPEDCPVCARIAGGESMFSVEIDRGGTAGTVECSVAPFAVAGRHRSYVQVVRDITERKRLAVERELLVHDLGERIKELRCLYAISKLIEKHDLDVPGLLSGVLKELPSAFRYPEHASAAITSDWGSFGASGSPSGARRLEVGLLVNGKTVGTLRVGYPDDLHANGESFLPEERELLDTVAQRIGEAIERIQADMQVKRLTYLYGMLSATNRAIVRCRSNDELLVRVFDALIRHGAFPKLFIAVAEAGAAPLRVVHSHGIDVEKLTELGAVLANPQSSFGQVIDELRKGEVIWATLPHAGPQDKWLDYLGAQGITERAILPLVREGQLFGVVGLYAPGPAAFFDQAQLSLLNEMAEDMEFALNGIAVNERREVAEQRVVVSELRFRDVFEESPIPMQIQSLSSGILRAINRAHQQWLGYALQDIATEEEWSKQVYPDPEVRRQLQAHWTQAIGTTRGSGEGVHSPELSLRCKDGSERIARGTMTVVGDDAIIAWTDLTEIRRNEQALRESEQHFRGMIEQTITGIYVRRDGKFIYVNPRYSEIVGWSSAELIGQNVLNYTLPDPDNIRRIQEAWARLEAGERSVSYTVPLLCKNGKIIELGLHASPIDWDGKLATIVMAEDITERKRAEEQIASYVKQLEASMRGTLQAVSNMIDLRDPYTAGHERRVGLIAGVIGREMGWSEERCRALEMVGLVHDIGKIAVPVEILSKPGRLNPMEMNLVKAHAQAGYEILKDVPFSFPVAEVIRQHHERLDGSGYPRGLKGADILPEARVLAVADVLESMSAHRPYRPALGVDAALVELERGRGTLYEPEVLDAVFRLLRDKGYTLPE